MHPFIESDESLGLAVPERPIRPDWAKRFTQYMNNDLVDLIPEDGSDDDILDAVTDAATAVLCRTYGHHVENDQCMIPSHRYCVWCSKGMPNIEPGLYFEPAES